jgi:hypothetical protein
MTTPVEAAEAPVTLRAALFCAALDAACQVEGAELATALGLGDAAPAGHAERRARAACILGLSEPSAAPLAPKPDNRAAIEAAFDRALPDRAVPDPAGREAPPLRVIAGTRPARAPVRVLQGDPARQVPLARALGERLRARGFSLSALAVCVAAELHVAASSSWWRRPLGEAS